MEVRHVFIFCFNLAVRAGEEEKAEEEEEKKKSSYLLLTCLDITIARKRV